MMSAARTLLYGYSALLQFLFLMPVSAQHATPAAKSNEVSDSLNEIVVTSTRIRNANFEAPTPVQEISIEMIDQRGTTNVADIINEMPAFTGTLTPSSTTLNSRQNGVNAVDLRGLGANRNLVLLNGRRAAPFDEFGDVDLNAVPALAINRVEVVTGGASAAWGSAAISGVVNLIYDEKLDRLKLNVQYGESGKSDAGNVRVSAAWGSKISDDRGHVLIAADYDDDKGVPLASARGWQRRSPGLMANPADTGPNDGIPQFIIRDNSVLFLASPNGITLPGADATSNLEFFPDGAARPRALGENLGGVLMTGGSGSRLGDQGALVVPTRRFNLLAAAHLDVSNRLTLFGEASFAESKSRGVLVPPFTFGDVVIQPDNAYLPANIAALSEPFVLFRTFEEISPIGSVSKNGSS